MTILILLRPSPFWFDVMDLSLHAAQSTFETAHPCKIFDYCTIVSHHAVHDEHDASLRQSNQVDKRLGHLTCVKKDFSMRKICEDVLHAAAGQVVPGLACCKKLRCLVTCKEDFPELKLKTNRECRSRGGPCCAFVDDRVKRTFPFRRSAGLQPVSCKDYRFSNDMQKNIC